MKIVRNFMIALLWVGSAAWAATPPALLNYQGVLRDAAGAPEDGSFDMVFRFYSLDSGGTLLMTDAHNSGAPSGQVAVANGLFTAQLGAGTVAAGSEPDLVEIFRDNAAVWLEIQVGAETLSPRVRVLASAYAQNAKTLDGNEASAFAAATHTQTPATGGTGINTASTPAGNLLYTSAAGTWSTLAAGSSGQLLRSTGAGVQWVDQSAVSDGDWTIAGSDMYSAVSGNVGIGIAAPANELDIQAAVARTGTHATGSPCYAAADPMVVGIALEGAVDGRAPVAGIATVKADATPAPIAKGDLLVTSPVPGHAMKAPRLPEPGTVVGKALEPLDAGTGTIKVLVMMR